MKRIMIVTNSLTGGGAERSMNLVANELIQRGLFVALIPINAGLADQITPSCEVFPLERKWKGGLLDTVSSLWNFNRVVRQWKPDLIVLNCDLPELFGALLLSSQKLVAVEHINHPWVTRKTLGRLVRKVLEIRKTTWVAVSAHLTIWPNKGIPFRILLNPIIFTSRSALSHSRLPQKSEKLKRLVFIGRLAEQKHPEWVVEIATKTMLPVQFIGAGRMLEELQATAMIRNLPITFSGQVIDPWALMKRGDLLLVPSKYEGDGLVVLEALHRNIPMLITGIPEFRRFSFPKTNYCDSIDDFVKTIESVRMNLTELLIPKVIAEPVLNPRSIQAVGETWMNFIISI